MNKVFYWACGLAAATGWAFGFYMWFECWRIRGL